MPQAKVESQLIRPPCVAGALYPLEKTPLKDLTDRALSSKAKPVDCKVAWVPYGSLWHAGKIAGSVYSRVKWPKRVIFLAPNPSCAGPMLAVAREGIWQTPLGKTHVASDLADALFKALPGMAEQDDQCLAWNHPIEVQLPYLYRCRRGTKMVPMVFQEQAELSWMDQVATGITEAIEGYKEPVLLVIVAHLSSYLPQAEALEQDKRLLDAIQSWDVNALLVEDAQRHSGHTAAAVGLLAAQKLGCRKVKQIAYQPWQHPVGDHAVQVGFAGLTFA